MRPSETHELVEREIVFPVVQETLIDEIGNATIESPSGSPASIGEVLERADESSYRTPGEVYETILNHLGEEYVGRKFYDDRGLNLQHRENLSF